jgi:transposase
MWRKPNSICPCSLLANVGAVAHDDTGIATLVARLQAVQPTLMVLEATGGSQRAVVAALAATGLPVVVVHSLPSA